MPNDKRSLMARALAKIAGPSAIKSEMDNRQARLGTGQTGGMFDMIYRKKKEREQAMNDAYNLDANPTPNIDPLTNADPAVNAAKMRGAGPDEPIDWNAYGGMPQEQMAPPPAPGFFQRLIGSDIPGSLAGQAQAPNWLVRLMMQKKRPPPPAQGQQ